MFNIVLLLWIKKFYQNYLSTDVVFSLEKSISEQKLFHM